MRWPWNRQGRDLLRPHELAVLDAIRLALSKEAAQLLDSQIAETAYVSRYIDDSYVDLYPRPRGTPRRDPTTPFPNRSLDLRLATVNLHGPRGNGKAVVSAVDGQLFEVHFSPSPRKLGKRDAIATAGVKLHADPMQVSASTAGHPDLVSLDLALRAELEDIWQHRPAWASAVADPSEVYLVHLGEGDYLMLAQLPDTTFVAGRLDPPGPGVTRFETEGDIIGDYTTLREAVESSGRSQVNDATSTASSQDGTDRVEAEGCITDTETSAGG